MDVWMALCLGSAALAAACAVGAGVGAWRAAPRDERRWRDRPPPLLRPVWPLAHVVGHHVAPLVPGRHLRALAVRLRRAELARAVAPEQWLGTRIVYALLGAITGSCIATASGSSVGLAALLGATLGVGITQVVLHDAVKRRELLVQRELPTYLDVLTLAVESGCSLVAAVGIATEKAHDGPLRRALERFLAELRAGSSRAQALENLDAWVAMPAMTSLVGALLQADRTGARLGDVLRSQSSQRTHERFARAEKLAMQAPVKMLGPLILCIFPCTFLILGFPIGMKLSEGF